jgi:hypothetical protein
MSSISSISSISPGAALYEFAQSEILHDPEVSLVASESTLVRRDGRSLKYDMSALNAALLLAWNKKFTDFLDRSTSSEADSEWRSACLVQKALASLELQGLPPSVIETGVESSIESKFLFRRETKYRIDSSSGQIYWIDELHQQIARPFFEGACWIADYYCQKYGINLAVLKDPSELLPAILGAREKGCSSYGFSVPDQVLQGHRTPCLYFKKSGKEYLLISDSVGNYNVLEYFLKIFRREFPELIVLVDSSNIRSFGDSIGNSIRQADEGSCVLDSLLFLKDALRLAQEENLLGCCLDQTEVNYQRIKGESLGHVTVYSPSRDLLKVVQNGKLFTDALRAEPLMTAKERTLGEKLAKHRKTYPHSLLPADAAENPDLVVHQDFRENAYLYEKGLALREKAKRAMLSMTPDQFEEICFRASGAWLWLEGAKSYLPPMVAARASAGAGAGSGAGVGAGSSVGVRSALAMGLSMLSTPPSTPQSTPLRMATPTPTPSPEPGDLESVAAEKLRASQSLSNVIESFRNVIEDYIAFNQTHSCGIFRSHGREGREAAHQVLENLVQWKNQNITEGFSDVMTTDAVRTSFQEKLANFGEFLIESIPAHSGKREHSLRRYIERFNNEINKISDSSRGPVPNLPVVPPSQIAGQIFSGNFFSEAAVAVSP